MGNATSHSIYMRILALESSCDESAVAVYDDGGGLLIARDPQPDRLAPGLWRRGARAGLARSRAPPAAAGAHRAGGCENHAGSSCDGVAYTAGPGLIGALLTGAALGRSLAYAWKVPAVAVHHLEGHLLAPLLEDRPPPFPHLALLVSGGHTMLIDVAAPGLYAVLGETRDDAAGEAFDKSAKLLGLPYPGGPELARLAASGGRAALRFPAAHAGSRRARVQLLGLEDRRVARSA